MRDEEKTREQLLAENESLRAMFSELKKAESECRWVEAALRESEERYKRLLESVTDYIYTVKVENGRPISTIHGPGCIAVTGYTSEHYQMYPNLWYQMIHEEDRKAVLDQAEKLLKGEAVQSLEHRIIHKDGSIRWVRNTPVPHHDNDGNLVSYDGIIVGITERKRAEEALRKSEERFRSIFAESRDGIVLIDVETGFIVDCNPEFEHQTGRRIEDLRKMRIWEVRPHGEVEAARQKFLETVSKGEGGSKDLSFQRPDGKIVPIAFLSKKVTIQGRQYLQSFTRDITEQKKAEEELKESEEKYRSIYENSQVGIYRTRMCDGKLMMANDAMAKMFGFDSVEEATAKYVTSEHYVDPGARERLLDTLRKHGRFDNFEARLMRNGGIVRWFQYSGRLVRDKGYIEGVATDITEKRHAEAQLQLFRDLLDHSSDAIFVVDPATSRLLDVNEAACHDLRYTRDELLQRCVVDIQTDLRDVATWLAHVQELRAQGRSLLEFNALRKDGSRFPVEASLRHTTVANQFYIIAIVRDITERKKAEEALERAKKEWEATFDSISDPLFIHDREFNVVRANRAYADAAGMKFKKFIERPYYEVFPKMDGPFKMCLKAQELREEEEEEFSCPVTNRIFKVRFFPIKDVNGGYLYSIHILEDITDRKRTEEELRLRAQLLDSTSDTIFLLDLNGKFVYLNEAAWKSRGYTRDELMGINLHVLDTPEYEKIIETRFRELMEKGQCIFESAHRCKDGSIMPVEISARFIETGGRKLVLSVIRDITERKKAQRRIKEEMEITSHLLMIAEATSHMTDIDRLMERVVHCGSKIMGCDICLSYLWDSETRVLSPSQEFGLSHNLVPLFKTESLDMKTGFVKEAMKGKKPIIVAAPFTGAHDAGVKPAATFPWIPDISTIALIPLIGRKGPLGLIVGIYVETPRRGVSTGFTERNMKVIKGISHQVSIALEEARLFKESVDRTLGLSHKIETIKTMHEIDRSILSTLEPQEILETAARMVARLMPCDRVTVALVDREKKGFVYAVGFGITAVPKGGLVPFEDTSATEVAETHRAQFVSNLSETKGLRPLEEKLLNEGFLSHIRVPLTIKDEVVGVLNVGAKRPSAFSPEDLSTLEKMAAQTGVALSNAKLISDMEELFLGTVKSLSSAIDAKSPWTAGHSERVTKYALDIAKEMGFDRDKMRSLELAGLLHDIGKIGTYDFLLDKPGKLEPDEIEIVRLHPVKGAAILESIKKFRDIIPTIRHHHEFYDGTGYPDRLKGEDIPFLARILAVADTYDAMKADRPYRPGRSMEFILEEFKRCSGTQFDPKVVEAFLKIEDKLER